MKLRALSGKLAGCSLHSIARELVDISCESLSKQKLDVKDESECRFLNEIRETIIKKKISPGEKLLADWKSAWNKDPAKLMTAVSIG